MRPQQGTLFLEKVIQEVDHQALRELNIPPEIKTDFKVVEHAFCQFNKYCRFANQGVPPLTFKSPAVFLKYQVCLQPSKKDNKVFFYVL